MRILTLSLFAAMATVAAGYNVTLDDKNADSAQPVNEQASILPIDPIVTGQTRSADNIDKWKAERARFLECPKCVADQPFPGE